MKATTRLSSSALVLAFALAMIHVAWLPAYAQQTERAKTLGKKLNYELVDVHIDRPGHDLRYSLSDAKIKAMGWKQPIPFEESLRRTIEWSVRPENQTWLEE